MEMVAVSSSDDNILEQNLPETISTTGNDDILKPGLKIKPEVSLEIVENLVERLYGITTSEIKELISYDDRNFLIHEDRNIKNPLIINNWAHGYVLKILNALDSRKLDFLDAQTEMLLFLRKKNITCPNPVKNVYGKYFSVESLNGIDHVVRLLEYLPGQILHEISPTNHLFYQCGEYIAKLDKALKSFHHDVYKSHRTLWMLHSVPKLKDFLYVLQDHDRKATVEQVIEAFETKVLSSLDIFEKGIIHGDFNEQNILLEKLKDRNEYRISGILDFGDTNYSPLIFELSIAMTYLMLQSKDFATGGLVLAGYSSVRPIFADEKKVLKYCVAARLCQSLVLGAYSNSLDPKNEYLLITQKAGWELLDSLWKDNLDKVDDIWANTADNYLKQSIK